MNQYKDIPIHWNMFFDISLYFTNENLNNSYIPKYMSHGDLLR